VVGSIDGTFCRCDRGRAYAHSQVGFTIVAGPTTPFKQAINSFRYSGALRHLRYQQSGAVPATTVFAGGGEDYINIDIPDNKEQQEPFRG